ncbi:MAG: hypothetical protein ACREMP_09880 [Candidatus Tyrphobacter sp.]
MIRYFVIATVLVVGIFVAVTAFHQYRLRIVVRGGKATMTPHASSSVPPHRHLVRGFHAIAPWALSALPECLTPIEEWKGQLRDVRAHLPRGARKVIAPALLQYGNCTVKVLSDSAVVTRGHDRMTIAPIAHLYTYEDSGTHGVALLRSLCAGLRCRSVLRVYERSGTL